MTVAAFSVVPARSQVRIEARSNVHPIHLRADGLEGEVEVEAGPDGRPELATAAPRGRLSLRVERLRGGNPLEDVELQRQVDGARFPTIEGVLSAVEPLPGAASCYRLRGVVDFRGVARACAGEVALEEDGEGLRLRGEAVFDIRDFGMEPPRVLLLRVEPEVRVTVDLVLEPRP
ncbi:MAG: hypothetical protein GEV08_12800 [Acidimicrobiia bacterium]|nr:hypothetical protein [Acidimicrobiia bacterium]